MYLRGARLKADLALINKTQLWLMNELAEVGIKIDKFSLSKVINGVYQTPRSEMILAASEQIIVEYRKRGREKSG